VLLGPHLRQRRSVTASITLVFLCILLAVIDSFTVQLGGSALLERLSDDAWTTYFATVAQVALPLAIASVAVPFLLTTFSTTDTTRVLRMVHAHNPLAWSAGVSAASGGVIALLVAIGPRNFLPGPTRALAELSLVLVLGSVPLLLAASLASLRRLDPYTLAHIVTRPISPESIARFGTTRKGPTGGIEIVRHNLNFNIADPFGPFHELMRLAWAAGDRVLVTYLLQTLTTRLAADHGFVLRHGSYDDLRHPEWLRASQERRQSRRLRDVPSPTYVVHVLHYFVRNSVAASRAKGGGDGQRRIFVLPLINLYLGMAPDPRLKFHRARVLDALTHIASDGADLTPQGDHEPFALLPTLLADRAMRATSTVGDGETDVLVAAVRYIAAVQNLAVQPDYRSCLGLMPQRLRELVEDSAAPVASPSAAHDPWHRLQPLMPATLPMPESPRTSPLRKRSAQLCRSFQNIIRNVLFH
jgi:hypothetical protein